jgi:hypothetical protein
MWVPATGAGSFAISLTSSWVGKPSSSSRRHRAASRATLLCCGLVFESLALDVWLEGLTGGFVAAPQQKSWCRKVYQKKELTLDQRELVTCLHFIHIESQCTQVFLDAAQACFDALQDNGQLRV